MLLSLHLTFFLESCCQISSKYGIHPKALLTNLVRHSANQLEVGIVFLSVLRQLLDWCTWLQIGSIYIFASKAKIVIHRSKVLVSRLWL